MLSSKPAPPPLAYRHVDVFSPAPFGGNSLTVFPDAAGLTTAQLQAVTREMRHFESIFLAPLSDPSGGERAVPVRARVFDLASELPFAGHPVLGAACVLHALADEAGEPSRNRAAHRDRSAQAPAGRTWSLALEAKTVQVRTEILGDPSRFRAVLDQGRPEFLERASSERAAEFAAALALTTDDLHPSVPLEVISTGLRYVIVPLVRGLERAHVVRPDFEALLATVGAEFAYLLDVGNPARPEARHWTNDGLVEDVATGSGAGCACAYLARHRLVPLGREVVLRQGRFTGRPSEIRLCAEGHGDDVTRILVGGDVALVGRGTLDALPGDEGTA